MLDLIRRVRGELGVSILISTHLMGDVERTCDAVVVLVIADFSAFAVRRLGRMDVP